MKKILITLFAISSITFLFAQNDKRLEGIEEDLNAILEATKAPSFAVAVVEGDKVIYAKGFGYRDYENKIPADANTLYAIGSSSKAFTSGILGQLRHEDKLSFDDSPIEYIPELRFYNDELNNNITIKDMMCHRTGIPRHDFSWYLFPTFDKDSLIQRMKYQEPFTGLREQWYYNNFMFLTQGVVAERITGKSWEDNIRERFFKPLGMDRSNVTIDELENSSNAALGYELEGDDKISKMPYYRIAAMRPAGSINSSVNEMANWLITWVNKGKFKGEEIFPESYVNEAMSSQMIINGALPDNDDPDIHFATYGYGWMMMSYKGHYRVEHGGNIDGFSASAAFYPTDSIGIVVLANQNGSAVPSLVRNTVADRMLKTERTDWLGRFVERQQKSKEAQKEAKANQADEGIANTRPSHILQDYTGNYSHPGYGNFDITLENDSLFANFKLKKFYLGHEHYDVFQVYEVTDEGIDSVALVSVPFHFTSNASGDISTLNLKIEPAIDNAIEFKRTPNEIEVDAAILEKYVGDYDLLGTTVKIYLKNEDTLYLFVEGQPEYELVATAEHKYSFKAVEGFKVEFYATDDGSVNEILLIQPHGNFKAQKK